MSRKRRFLLIGVGVVLVLVFAISRMSGSAIGVEAAVVARDTIEVVVREEGRTRVRDRFVVAAPITGRLARITLREGAQVTAGQLLARISAAPDDPRTAGVGRAQLDAAEAQHAGAMARVEEARALAVQAEREAERRKTLFDAGALSREEFEKAQLQAATAATQLESARAAAVAADAEVRAARSALVGNIPLAEGGATIDVLSPGAGRILRVLEESERVIPAGTPLLEIGDARGLEVVVDVLSADAVSINPGALVRIDGWGGDYVLTGKVRLVEPAAFTEISALGVEEQRVNVIVDLDSPPPTLGSGYRVEASIVTWSDPDALGVPTSALFQQDGAWSVFVIENGRAARRTVEVGRRGTSAAQVISGLQEGDVVILFPSDLIEDGVRVRATS